MDNWKIQLVVVIFCALVQTYQGLSHNADDERTPSEDWQVRITDLMLNLVSNKHI